MSFTVRAPIKSSNSILMPNWRSAASMMMGRRLDRIERSFLRSISGCISSRSNPVASMMIRISLSIRSWLSTASLGAGDACPMLSAEGPTVLVGVGKLVPPCAAIILERLWAMSFTVRAPIKSSNSILMPNWRSAASMMMGRRLDRIERSFLRSISGCISSRSNPVASMMIRISLSIRSWLSTASQMAEDTSPIGVLRPDAGTFLNAASEINLASLSTFRCPWTKSCARAVLQVRPSAEEMHVWMHAASGSVSAIRLLNVSPGPTSTKCLIP